MVLSISFIHLLCRFWLVINCVTWCLAVCTVLCTLVWQYFSTKLNVQLCDATNSAFTLACLFHGNYTWQQGHANTKNIFSIGALVFRCIYIVLDLINEHPWFFHWWFKNKKITIEMNFEWYWSQDYISTARLRSQASYTFLHIKLIMMITLTPNHYVKEMGVNTINPWKQKILKKNVQIINPNLITHYHNSQLFRIS